MYTLYTVYTVNTVYTIHHRNTHLKSPKFQALGTLKIPFNIVFDALFNRGYHPIQPLLNTCFYRYGHNWGESELSKMFTFMKMVITRVTNGSPDMILTAFDGKFHEKKDELPPEAHRHLKMLKQNNVEKVDPQKVEKKQCRKGGSICSYIPSYTFHIPSNSFR